LQVLKQWPIYFVGRILPAIIAFFGISLYTHLLDPASFGTYSLLLATSFFVGTTSYAWLRVAVLRMMPALEPDGEPDFVLTVALAFGACSLIVTVLILVILRVMEPALSFALVGLTAAAAISNAWFELNITMFQTRLRLGVYSVLQAARAISGILATIGFIHLGFKTEALIGGFVVGNCTALTASAIWGPAFRGTYSKTVFRRMFEFGWPSSVGSLAGIGATVQRYALQIMGGSAALGVYAVANDFAGQTVGLLVGTAAVAGQPLAFRARDSGSAYELKAQLRANALLIIGLGLGATTGIIALAQPIARVCFGAQFQGNAFALIVLSATSAFIGGLRSSYFEQAFEIAFVTRPIALLTWFRVIFYTGLSLWLIHLYGAIGAGVAAVIAEIVMVITTISWANRFLTMPIPWDSVARLALAAGAMVLAIQFVPERDHLLGLVLAILLGGFVYVTVVGLLYFSRVQALIRPARTTGSPP